MKLYPFEQILDEHFGPIGTPDRDAFEKEVNEAVESYKMAERFREAREQSNLTLDQLSKKAGVEKSQIRRIEKGKPATLYSFKRLSQALGIML